MLTLDPPPETYRWHFAPALSLHLPTKFGDDFLLWDFSGVTNWPRMFRSPQSGRWSSTEISSVPLTQAGHPHE
jgi:hypothetical protein